MRLLFGGVLGTTHVDISSVRFFLIFFGGLCSGITPGGIPLYGAQNQHWLHIQQVFSS